MIFSIYIFQFYRTKGEISKNRMRILQTNKNTNEDYLTKYNPMHYSRRKLCLYDYRCNPIDSLYNEKEVYM